METDFIICQVSWLTQVKRNYDFNVELWYSVFKSAINYLQSNHLTNKLILNEGSPVQEDTCIKFSDLTADGFLLVKKCYDKWTDKAMDGKITITDYRIFDKELKKIRDNK